MSKLKMFINKIKEYKIWKYLREVSVVVIGVAITLLSSHFIGLWNKKREMDHYLNYTKIELEENKGRLIKEMGRLKHMAEYSDFLTSSTTFDSIMLENYKEAIHASSFILFRENVFEMFKNSGVMSLDVDDKDKKLLLSLWTIYDDLSLLKESVNWLYLEKRKDLRKDLKKMKNKNPIPYDKKQEIKEAPMYNSFAIEKSNSVLKECKKKLDNLTKIILDLETRNGINVYLKNDYIQVASPDTINAIELYSPTDKLLKLFKPEKRSYQIPTKDLTSATYFVKVITKKAPKKVKVFVEKTPPYELE